MLGLGRQPILSLGYLYDEQSNKSLHMKTDNFYLFVDFLWSEALDWIELFHKNVQIIHPGAFLG